MDDILQQAKELVQFSKETSPGTLILVGSHPEEQTQILVLGDYANEGEPDLVIEVWGSEDDELEAKYIGHLRNDAPDIAQAFVEAIDLIKWIASEAKVVEQATQSAEHFLKQIGVST